MVRIRKQSQSVESGQQHGKWEVLGPPFSMDKSHTWFVVCRCDCGNVVTVNCKSLVCDSSSQCSACRGKEAGVRFTTHGASAGDGPNRLYRIWSSMKTRCTNQNSRSYSDYGGRGIAVCDEWMQSFEVFRSWAMANGYADDLTIDRKENDKGYSPDNCQWANRVTQGQNTRSGRGHDYSFRRNKEAVRMAWGFSMQSQS